MSRGSDLSGLIRGLQLVVDAGIKLQEVNAREIWVNSNVRLLVARNCSRKSQEGANRPNLNNVPNLGNGIVEGADRLATVLHGIKEYARNAPSDFGGLEKLRHAAAAELKIDTKITSRRPRTDHPQSTIKLTREDQELLARLEMEHGEKLKRNQDPKREKDKKEHDGPIAVPNPKSKQKLSANSKQRTVPSSRFGRMVSFGSLAAGLGVGTATEWTKRLFGFSDTSDPSTLFLTQSNLDRIVDTLCKVRGAALKLGQIMSIQDDSVVNPQLAKALERVRKSADFMPNWQVEQVMTSELGADWRLKFVDFEETPFAAASIGQVHMGKLPDGRQVAVKIQYPGVAQGINSDIDNLAGIMKLWNIFPKGIFLENLMSVAKRELAWEVDYHREAECTKKFKQLFAPHKDFRVPEVIDDLSSKQVFTTEFMGGIPVDQCFDLPEDDRRFIADKVMELCLLELLEFRYMQTDPNWANFLYDRENGQLLLLDFGASREYSKDFVDKYVKILKATCDGDRATVLRGSKELGFLTGYESKVMEEAHVDAVMILGEVFRSPGEYDFAANDMTGRIQNLVPTMMHHRLCPPPEEVYSLHRKLSGIFLLCSKLKVSVQCREKFLRLHSNYVSENP